VLTLTIPAAPNVSSVWVRVVDEVTGADLEQEVVTDLTGRRWKNFLNWSFGNVDYVAPAPAPDIEHRCSLTNVGVLEAVVAIGGELRNQLGPHVLPKLARRRLGGLQRRVESLVATYRYSGRPCAEERRSGDRRRLGQGMSSSVATAPRTTAIS
jgi:hypothetical protein